MSAPTPEFVYDIVVAPGDIKPEIAEKWARRLADPATIAEIKEAIQAVDYREALMKAAERFGEFMGSDDPRRALAALKHRAALAAVDPNAVKQKLIEALDTKFSDAVMEGKDKYAARTAYVLPAVEAAVDFGEAFTNWLSEKTMVARYFRGAVQAPATYAGVIGAMFAHAVTQGALDEATAEGLLGEAAKELNEVLNVIVRSVGYAATVSVDIDATASKATIHVEISPSG